MTEARTNRCAPGRGDAYAHGDSRETTRLPRWLSRPLARPGVAHEVTEVLGQLRLNTVCVGAKCPNRGECFSQGTATFLIMGEHCTRSCRFCAIDSHPPAPLDADEPDRIAEAVERLELSHVVITTVTRDDLPDGGASHFAAVIQAVRTAAPAAAIEVLTSDFGGRKESIETVLAAGPDVFNHNMETVPRLYEQIRPEANYSRSLEVLRYGSQIAPGTPTKSGLMLGLGETYDEVLGVMEDLRANDVSMLTLGQYLRPSPAHAPVVEFVEPRVFGQLRRAGEAMGFRAVASAPFVRSSYHAGQLAAEL